MKGLRNLLLVVLVTMLAWSAYGQSFGIRAGLNMSKFEVKDNDDTYSDDFSFMPGFHVGILGEIPVAGVLSIEGAALFSTRGFKYEDEMVIFDEKIEFKSTSTMYYIVVPITVKATVDVGPVSVFGQLGGYAGAGMSGNYKTEATSGGITDTSEGDILFGNDEVEDDYKQLDFGLTAGAGVQVKNIRAGVAYDHGLANISHYSDNGYTTTNRVFSVFVALVFGGN